MQVTLRARGRHHPSRRAAAIVIAATFFFCSSGVSTSAQESTTGMIEGVVAAKEGAPLAGAAVTLAGPRGARGTVTGAAGRFVFRDLIPGRYSVKAEAAGFATVVQTDVQVVLAQRTELHFALPAGLTEQIRVTSEAPLLDIKKTSTGATISVADFVRNVPFRRDFTELFTLAPGVTSGLRAGPQNYSISGSSGLENSYLIDGVNITNSGYGAYGAYNWIYRSLGAGVTSDFIDEVEIKSAGFEAEFGQATGGVVNTIVKSGTNELSGGLSIFGSPGFLAGTRKLQRFSPDFVSTLETSRSEVALSLGGPFIRDTLFGFAAYNPVRTEITRIRTVEDESVLYDSDGELRDPDQPSGGRTETAVRQIRNYAAKISWFVRPRHRLELTAFGDPSEGHHGAQRDESLRRTGEQGYSALDYGGGSLALKYFGSVTAKVFVDAMWARRESEMLELSTPIYRIWDRTVTGFGGGDLGRIETGGLGWLADTDERIDQLALKLTATLGDHEIKLGYQRDDTDYGESNGYSGPTWTVRLPVATFDADGEPLWTGDYFEYESTTGAYVRLDEFSASPTGLSYLARNSKFDPLPVVTENEEQSAFFQDTWAVTPRVTLRLGVRWTDASIGGGRDFEVPFTTVSRGGFATELADLSRPRRFESATVEFPSEWAPRFGLTWDLHGGGRHKLYAGYAEYVQRMTQRLSVRALSARLNFRQRWADPNLSLPIEDGLCPVDDGSGTATGAPCHTVPRVFGGSVIDSGFWEGTRLPATNELLLGYAREIGSTMGFDVRYVHRDLERIIEDFSYVPQESLNNAFWGPWLGFPFEPFPDYPASFGGDFIFGNIGRDSREAAIAVADATGETEIADLWRSGAIPDFPAPKRDYDALEAVFDKRLSGSWLLRAAYRYARLEGNYEGLLRNDNGQDEPNLTALYDFPDTPLLRGQFLDGRLNTDVEHNLQVYGSYLSPMGLDLGAGLRWSSGTPRFPMLWNPFYFAPEFPGRAPVYASWWMLDGDPNDTVLMLGDGPGATPNRMSDGTIDADGQLVFSSYEPGATDVRLTNFVFGDESFLYSYTPARRDSGGRTPSTLSLDLHFAYDCRLGGRDGRLTLMLDAFNVLDRQAGLLFDDVIDQFNGAEPNPNFGRPWVYQEPRTVRLGLRWSF